MAFSGRIETGGTSKIRRNKANTFAVRLQCNGKLVAWEPRMVPDYAGDGHWDAPTDKAVKPYHAATPKYLGGGKFSCPSCKVEWHNDLVAIFHEVYPRKEAWNSEKQ